MASEQEGGDFALRSSRAASEFAHGAGQASHGSRTDSASRLIKVRPQKLYWAFVDPDLLVRWLPPEGMRGRLERFEPQAGGAYRMVLTYTGASDSFEGKSSPDTDIVEGRFVELVPGEKIVQAVAFDSPDPAFAGEMLMTWKLEADGEGTKVTVVCEHVPGGIGKREHEQALASTLQNLERIVS
ncbi:ATPase [Saccharibacillus sp. VR-M41]|uniref:ATPase n=2 Tax=Saccharibacillus alkalitolerans TaxID=2705290 RepID=A0ABX0FA88_9BACL|nr:ATPase [Saccharibacillus alkalitolerans]